MLLKSLTTRGGRTLEIGRFTVLVGPNNCGKSECLRDVLRMISNAEPGAAEPIAGSEPPTLILGDLEYHTNQTVELFLRGLRRVELSPAEIVLQGCGPSLRSPYQVTMHPDKCRTVFQRATLAASALRKSAISPLMFLRVVYIPDAGRETLVHSSPAGNPAEPPSNLLQALHDADASVHDALDVAWQTIVGDRHLALDATQRVQLTLRLAEHFPAIARNPGDAVRHFETIRRLDDEGTGLQSVAAIVLAVLLGQGRVILIDEPALALHPRVARRLGQWLGENAAQCGCQIMLATHQPAFVDGLTAASDDVTFLRLTRKGSATKLAAISAKTSRDIVRSPAFATQPIADIWFRSGVVLTETESDRAVCAALADRAGSGSDISFLHTQGQEGLVAALRQCKLAKLPFAAVLHFDILSSATQFGEIYETVLSKPLPKSWQSLRDRLATHLEGEYDEQLQVRNTAEMESFLEQLETGTAHLATATEEVARVRDEVQVWAPLRRAGIAAIPMQLRIRVDDLVDELQQGGLFLSPGGDLCQWLVDEAAPSSASEPPSPSAVPSHALQHIAAGHCPPSLQAFCQAVIDFVQSQTTNGEPAEPLAKTRTAY